MGDYNDGWVYRCCKCGREGTRKEVSWTRVDIWHDTMQCEHCYQKEQNYKKKKKKNGPVV